MASLGSIYNGVVIPPLTPKVSTSQTIYGALFLLLDVVPDYVEKTFGFNSTDPVINSFLFSSPIIREGDKIPKGLEQALILYNASVYHWQQYMDLCEQIKSINPGIAIVGVPVQG